MISIMIYSPAFAPGTGGLEFMSRMLAEEFTSSGHRVTVVTKAKQLDDARYGFQVVAQASYRLLQLTLAADVVLHMNVSLKGLWPFLFVSRPLVLAHHAEYQRPSGRRSLRDRLKYAVARLATNISCSSAITTRLPAGTKVVWNAYDDRLFRRLCVERSRDLVFVGRLVSDKGVDLLLAALRMLRVQGLKPTLTVVGFGPEEARLRERCGHDALSDQVVFAGKRTGSDLVSLLNQHRVMVIPSRSEPFGIVALEGIACGCVVIGSDAGGLPEAIGQCGIVFPNGNVKALSEALERALLDPDVRGRVDAQRPAHLARFSRREVARRYLDVIESALAQSRRA